MAPAASLQPMTPQDEQNFSRRSIPSCRLRPRFFLNTFVAFAALGVAFVKPAVADSPDALVPVNNNAPLLASQHDAETTTATSTRPTSDADDVSGLLLTRRVRNEVIAAPGRRSPQDSSSQIHVTVTDTLEERSTPTTDSATTPLPSPFDSLGPSPFQIPGGSNSCPKFMNKLLSDPTFKSCYPISMLIQTSLGFFDAQKQLVSIVKVLDASCAVDVVKCTPFFSQAARNLTLEGNCKSELDQNQTEVSLAYRGLRAYKVLYSAACLQNPAQNSYCFANAVTNSTTPSDSYLYFMPYGLALPGASRPTCNWCTQNTMSIYHAASADRAQPVSGKYEDAARQINTLCGPNFVNTSLPAALNAAGLAHAPPAFGALLINTLFALALLVWFL